MTDNLLESLVFSRTKSQETCRSDKDITSIQPEKPAKELGVGTAR